MPKKRMTKTNTKKMVEGEKRDRRTGRSRRKDSGDSAKPSPKSPE